MLMTLLGIVCSALASLFFSTISYALRDFSRARLEDCLATYKRSGWLEETIEHQLDLSLVTAVGRLAANMLLFIPPLRLFHQPDRPPWIQYSAAIALASVLGLICSVAVPAAIARYAGESLIALSIRFLHGMRVVLLPLIKVMHAIDRFVLKITGANPELQPEQVEKDILSAVEDGEKEGVVGEQEREMIQSVIQFRDTQVDQTMTARPQIVAVELAASLEQIKHTIVETGHSRLPVYDGTLDHIVGVLYARDLLRYLGLPPQQFDVRTVMRPAIFVPETKPLRDMLHEFRLQKVHIAVVLDEYGATAGLVTIEDILEELVGEISDEHEPHAPAMLKRLSDTAFEADARLAIDQANQQCGLALPDDAGYETLGGFALATLGRIPQKGTAFDHGGVRYTVLDAEPQRVKRLKIDLPSQPPRE